MKGQVFLGQYEVVRPLGEGAMGKVFLARQISDGQAVVVKVMHDAIAKQPKFKELFEREMKFMARFKHPNVVALLDASTRDSKGLCIVMEYVSGCDLENMLQKHKRFPPERIAFWLMDLCSALQAAHNVGIIHRDLKPANMMLVDPDTDKEHIKVMDFGLAKLSDQVFISMERLKGSDGIIASGTPEYIAPEQVRGDEIDSRSDLYSVGVILYELLTGRLPFSFDRMERTLEAHRDSPPPSFAAVGARDISRDIEIMVQRCLCKFPVERPQTAWELVQGYEKALGQKFLPDEAPSQKAVEVAEPVIFHKKPVEENAIVHQIEAWMPEPIAVVKLRGFVQDVRGEPLESVPGKIRVRLGTGECVYQMPRGGGTATQPQAKKGWFGGSAPAPTNRKGIEMELKMEKKKDTHGNAILQITMLLRPEGGGPLPRNPDWHALCDQIYKDLRAYVMGKA